MANETVTLTATQWIDGTGAFRQCRLDNEALYDASVGVGGIADIELDAMVEYPERIARHKMLSLIWHSVKQSLGTEEFPVFLKARLTPRVYAKAKAAVIAAYKESIGIGEDVPPPLVDGAGSAG